MYEVNSMDYWCKHEERTEKWRMERTNFDRECNLFAHAKKTEG